MKCNIRKWRLSDANDLALALSNKNVQDNLRDGLPYPYTAELGYCIAEEYWGKGIMTDAVKQKTKFHTSNMNAN